MAMTAQQITAELQRKKNNGIAPTNAANAAQYSTLKPQTPATTSQANASFTPNPTAPKLNQGQLDYFEKNYGGIDKYAADQNARYASGDSGLRAKILADAMRVGYGVQGTSGTQKTQNEPAMKQSAAGQFAPKTYSAMDYATALAQSNQQVDPLYARAAENVKAEQYQNSLNAGELASARGGAQSGLAADLQNKVSIAGQNSIKDLDAQRAAQVAEMAQALVNRSEDNAFRNRGQDFNEWLGSEQLGLSRDELSRLSSRDQVADEQFNRNFEYGVSRDQVADSRYDKEFAYGASRDKIADERYKAEFDRDVAQWGEEFALEKAVQNRQLSQSDARIALDRAQEARISSGGGGSGRSGGSGGSSGSKPSTASVIQDINLPRSAASMETYIINNLPGGKNVAGPPSPNQLSLIESMILDNPNLSESDMVKLYKKFGIPLPE